MAGTGEIKNKITGETAGDSLGDGDVLLDKKISEMNRGADVWDSTEFAKKLAKKGHGSVNEHRDGRGQFPEDPDGASRHANPKYVAENSKPGNATEGGYAVPPSGRGDGYYNSPGSATEGGYAVPPSGRGDGTDVAGGRETFWRTGDGGAIFESGRPSEHGFDRGQRENSNAPMDIMRHGNDGTIHPRRDGDPIVGERPNVARRDGESYGETSRQLRDPQRPNDRTKSREGVPQPRMDVDVRRAPQASERARDTQAKGTGPEDLKDTSAMGISGNKILDGLQAQHIEPTSNEAASLIKEIGVQIAERIIATNEALGARQEVRVTLQESVLKDTEVIISKDGKSLNVTFVTGSGESADVLNYRSGELRAQLMERLNDVSNIEVEIEHQGSSDNQNSDGRSQNRFGNQQQQDEEEKGRQQDEE
jgi:hypothetical protein